MPDTPTPAPVLTDEQMGSSPADDAQIDDDVRALVEGESMPEETAWAIIAAVVARAKREARGGMANDLALLIDQECPHEPDEHAEGTCEVCDYAFAMAQMVRDYAEAANDDHA